MHLQGKAECSPGYMTSTFPLFRPYLVVSVLAPNLTNIIFGSINLMDICPSPNLSIMEIVALHNY